MPTFLGTLLGRLWRGRIVSSRTGDRRGATVRKKSPFSPTVESLEDRLVPTNTGAISGHVFLDPTGNGLRPGDPGQSGATVKLFKDSNHNGVLDSADRQAVAPQVTLGDGSFAFVNLASGRYFVSEAAPSGFVRTSPNPQAYHTVNLLNGQVVSGQDFANFQSLNTSVVTHLSFTVTSASGVKTVVTDLRGHTHQGDTVTANFTIASGATNVFVSLVTYDAPGSSFDANTASAQVPIQIATGTFGPGRQSLTVQLPENFYQVDFVLGSAIDQLGPAGGNLFYSAEGRLLSADNSGKQTAAPTLSGHLLDTNNLPPAPGSAVTVVLTGYDTSGNVVSQSTGMVDAATGFYSFTGLAPGVTYTLTVNDTSGTYAPETSPGITTNGASISNFDVTLQPNPVVIGGGT